MTDSLQPGKSVDLNTKYSRLFRDGRLVQVHVGKWSMAAKLDETDLPLQQNAVIPAFVKLGSKMLINESELRKFNTIENLARTCLRNHSYNFPISHAHFVPNKKLMPVLDTLYKQRAEFMAAVDTFITNYDALTEANLAQYPEHRGSLLPFYPSPGFVRSCFSFRVVILEVAFPKQMKEIDLLSVQAEAGARAKLQAKFETEWQHQYDQTVQMVDEFLKEALVSTRGKIIEVFETIANKIKKREVVSTVNLKTMASIIETFEGLDFLNDAAVKSKLATVKGVINSGRDFKESQSAISALAASVDEVLAVARATTDVDALTGDYIRRIDL